MLCVCHVSVDFMLCPALQHFADNVDGDKPLSTFTYKNQQMCSVPSLLQYFLTLSVEQSKGLLLRGRVK